MNGQYKIGQTVLGNWSIVRKLGEGSFGKVFEIVREDFGQSYRAALKIITVPQSEAELRGAMEEGMDIQGAEKYFHTVVEDIVREFALMARLKGTANIVSYEDHTVLKHQNGIGWDILIRMELLTPLLTYAYSIPFSRRDIIRLGIDMCRALELCQRYNIIHRDIKPENIFVSDNGDFKLGDFGIARTVEKTMSGLSKKGTYNYMAPEVYRGADYGFSVDTYSLGIVLYRMLNRNRIPFMPPAPEAITYASREMALAKRMGGEEIPKAFHAEGRLAEIVAKSVVYNPKDRYPSPMQMREELEAILYDKADAEAIYPDGDELKLMENIYASKTPDKADAQEAYDASDGTSSMFGEAGVTAAGGGAALGDATSATESVFGGRSAAVDIGDSTSRTESIFEKKEDKTGSAGKIRTTAAQKQKKKPKVWQIAIPAALALAIGIGATVYISQNNKNQQIQQQQENSQNVERYESLMSRASTLYDSDPEQAAILLLEANQIFPEETEPRIGYAYALYRADKYDECIVYIEGDLALGKEYGIEDQSRLSEILGAAYFEKGEYAAAASFFRLSTAGGDITVSAMRDYAVALGRLGDVDAAAEVLQRMFDSGASEIETRYVQAEVDYARGEFTSAEYGFKETLRATNAEATLQIRAFRSLAELYRDCSVLEKLAASPIYGAAQLQAELLADGMTRFNLSHDSTLFEMLALAYYEAHRANPGLGDAWLERSADAFEQLMELGIVRDYIFNNLFAVYFELGDYERTDETLGRMRERYQNSYVPHALRSILLIRRENDKPDSERDFQAAFDEYKIAESKITSSDDMAYFRQVESLIGELIEQGWLFSA